ncbi:MAG TPA: hypothetical protein VFZ64_04520 [Nocardioidaceae bacterium]
MRESKRRTAARVLMYRVHVVGSHGPDSTFSTRSAAADQVRRLRDSGVEAVVHPVHTPLPGDPWLRIHE